MSHHQPLIGFGSVFHARLRPVRNAFTYRTYFLMLPMRSLADANRPLATPLATPLAMNRRGLISFHDQDHGDGRSVAQGGALAWLDELLSLHGIHDAQGEVWLHCYPRVLGYAFKPVSFWFCHSAALGGAGQGQREQGPLRAIVVEVNNTFGQRHCYLLDAPAWGQEIEAPKAFHVSPFCQVQGRYRFVFKRDQAAGLGHCMTRIDHDTGTERATETAGAALLQTSISGQLEPLTRASLRKAFWRYPVLSVGVVFHIHWQALRLWVKRVQFIRLPALPAQAVTHVNASAGANANSMPR